MIFATAGHIDHGKTRLVKALTGIDTDLLPEERARGISIDLGFAHADLGEHKRASFIDVPGHERFVRNMLAGVSGIDAALLVVAADDGIMPQTLEHLHILDLLDVRCGAVVITKMDVATAQRVEEVTSKVLAALTNTSLEGAGAFPVSAVTGEGLPALLEWMHSVAAETGEASEDGRRFRMPVDRAFTVPGSGTVVTGTVRSGMVAVGDQLMVSPGGSAVRVRGVRVQGVATARALPRQRCALNLVGVGIDSVGRGSWVLDPCVHAPTSRLDVRLRVLKSERESLAHWTPVHLHLGTADVTARVVVPSEGTVVPGTTEFVQLVTERPIAALHGDRFVVRDQNARRTMGGGTVLDPFAPKRKRGAGLRAAELQVYERRTPDRVLTGLLELAESGLDLQLFARAMGLSAASAEAAQSAAGAVVLGKSNPVAITRVAAEALTVRVLSAVKEFHALQPQVIGIDISDLRRSAAPRLGSRPFHAFVRELANRQLIVLSKDTVRLTEHDASDNPADEKLWLRVHGRLRAAGVHTPLIAELATALNIKEQLLRDFLHRKSRSGDVRRVTGERFCLRASLAALAATAVQIAQKKEDGFFSAPEFRDAIKTGRGLAIHYLEFFDQLGITQRFGDKRRIGKDYVMQFGPGEPIGPEDV